MSKTPKIPPVKLPNIPPTKSPTKTPGTKPHHMRNELKKPIK